MKRIAFHADTNRSGGILHIETDMCIVNIHVGLFDAEGRPVTNITIIPDNYAGEAPVTLVGTGVNRVYREIS